MNARSESQSEGEYLSSDCDTKATKPLPYNRDTRVNRHSRTHSSAQARTSTSRSPSRSRSRSPYRAPKGEKRRREDDNRSSKYDPRTFRVRYEDHQRSNYDSNRQPRSKKSRTHSPNRSRSRSPFRHDKEIAKTESRGAESRNSPSVSTHDQRRDRVQHLEISAKIAEHNRHRPTSPATPGHQDSSTAVVISTAEDLRAVNLEASSPIVDEAAVIEARRKRREAIKNQYRRQPPTLLVQALGVTVDVQSDDIGTPSNTSISPSSVPPSTPGTPGPADISAPQSPITDVGKDEDMADKDMFGSPDPADEHSAADYDPTADMQDERARHDKRLFKEDADSEKSADQQVREPAKSIPKVSKQDKPVEFDMFAEDDQDMFADELNEKPDTAPASAKKLDQGMMDNWDDTEGYYLTNLREKIDDRYEVSANLGRGMFASVVRATDVKSKKLVAIKIIRSNETMKRAGLKEVDILKDLAANDPDDRKHVVRLLRSFDHKGHLCMVFENMDMNLREVLKKFGRDIGLNLKAIRAYAQQLFLGLTLLRKCQYLHADLKPDNILADETRTKIKIADLGSASTITENATAPYLVSRFYRAPEVILGIEYDYGIDMWSTGCTLFELYTGKILFTGRNNNNMLKTIMECRGKFPHKLLRRGTLTYDYFDDLLNFKSQEQDKATGRIITKVIDIKAKPVRDLKSRVIPKDKRFNEQERKELELFADLLDKCLDLRPEKRITPTEALKHPFITRPK